MKVRSPFSVLLVGLLSLSQVVGFSEVARSQADEREQQVSQKSAIPNLIPLLKDSVPNVRQYAAVALGKMGESSKSALPNLIPLLKDSGK